MSKTIKRVNKSSFRKSRTSRKNANGGGLFTSSKYPTVKEIVERFLKDYGMTSYPYYGNFKRTFTIGTSKTAEYQLGKLIDIITNIANLILEAAKQSEKYQKSSNVKEYVLKFMKFRFGSNTILECSTKCDRQPSYYSNSQDCPNGCEQREVIDTQSSSQTVKRICYKIEDGIIDNDNYNSRLIEILKKLKEIEPTKMKYFNGKLKSTDSVRDYEYRLRVIETLSEYYQLIHDNINLFNREVISYIASNGSGINTNKHIKKSKTDTTTYYPCDKK